MSLPLLPVWIADLLGSALMCCFSLLAVRVAMRLRRTDPNNVVWTYLLWLCYALAAFALSRSVGHIVKRLLLTIGYDDSLVFPAASTAAPSIPCFLSWWPQSRCFSNGSGGSTSRSLAIKRALQEAHGELLYLNRNLEQMVEERTRELSASERKYRRIFEASQDMIMVTTSDGAHPGYERCRSQMLGIPSAVCSESISIVSRTFSQSGGMG